MTDSHPHFQDGGLSSSSSSHQGSSSSSRSRSRNLPLHHSQSNVETRDELLQLAAAELEAMRSSPGSNNNNKNNNNNNPPQCRVGASTTESHETERSFPPACLHLLHALPNNTKCHDCKSGCDATWASVSYGITLCLQCSGKHRGLGVQCSFIKSLTLDSWKRREILCMLEGGNEQMGSFFDRHGMGNGGGSTCNGNGNNGDGNNNGLTTGLDRYKTKAASFYRQHLLSHAKSVAKKGGLYEGREASRKRSNTKNNAKQSSRKASKGKNKTSREGQQPKLPTVTEKECVVGS